MRWVLLICFICCGCSLSSKKVQEFRGIAMTIPYHIIVSAPANPSLESLIQTTFAEIDATYNYWNPDSELSSLNRWKSQKPFQCSEQLWSLLQWCDRFVLYSNALFDPTIAPLQRAWRESLEKNTIPSRKSLQALQKKLGWEQLLFLNNRKIIKKNPLTTLDLGGIAKGYAVDLLVERLSTLCSSLYVEWGGEIRVQGNHPEGRPWKIGIRDPVQPKKIVTTIELTDAAIATSGNYLQYWEIEENGKQKKLSHIMNTQTQKPYEITSTKINSVTVQASSCLAADAIATILLMTENQKQATDLIAKKLQSTFPELRCWIFSSQQLQEEELSIRTRYKK